MAAPTDPLKLAAYVQRRAEARARYRQRQTALRAGAPIPAGAELRQEARRFRLSSDPTRLQEQITRTRMTRTQILESLPQARNPRQKIRVERETERAIVPAKTANGRASEARRQEALLRAQSAVGQGRSFKRTIVADLMDAARDGEIPAAMMKRVRRAATQLAASDAQSIGILLSREGARADIDIIITKLRYYGDEGPDEWVRKLEKLVSLAERAEGLYGREAVGVLNV